MKKIFTYLARFIFGCLLAFVVFYFWASSATLHKNEYAKLLTNTYKTNIKNDSIYSNLALIVV